MRSMSLNTIKQGRSPTVRIFVDRHLPYRLAELLVIYIAYIRPFSNLFIDSDGDYLFCSEDNNDKYWDGKKLSETLRESQARLKVKINLWAYRHIVVAITQVHVKVHPPF
jgi:hypothetical protein